MQPVTAPSPARIDIDARARVLAWHPADTATGAKARTVPWFPSLGVLDYARADRPFPAQRTATPAGTAPAFGDPLIVRTDLAAVFWRAGSVLHSAPIRDGRVDLAGAAAVDWAAAGAEREVLRVVEHNLAQCSADLPTLDPPLHVVQVDRSGRLALSHLVADADGSPVIGPTPRHYQPYHFPGELEAATAHGLPALVALWEQALRRRTTDGGWRFVPPEGALDTLAGLGFAVTGAAVQRPGLAAALHAAAGRQWVPGWYGGTRLLALARFERADCGGDLQYLYHAPGSRRVAVAADGSDPLMGDGCTMQGPSDVETRPRYERVWVTDGARGYGESMPVDAGRVALHEPVLIDGPLPVHDAEASWSAACRRCGAPMSSGLVGRHDFVPYVHELAADAPASELWCDAYPSASARRRPHAPACRVVPRPART